MTEDRLDEIRAGIEGLDTGAYHGADMLADALVEKNSEARELLEEVERLRGLEAHVVGQIASLNRVIAQLDEKIVEATENGNPSEVTELWERVHRLRSEAWMLESFLNG